MKYLTNLGSNDDCLFKQGLCTFFERQLDQEVGKLFSSDNNTTNIMPPWSKGLIKMSNIFGLSVNLVSPTLVVCIKNIKELRKDIEYFFQLNVSNSAPLPRKRSRVDNTTQQTTKNKLCRPAKKWHFINLEIKGSILLNDIFRLQGKQAVYQM